MTDQQRAMRQALEALRDYHRSDDDRLSVAMGILIAALAQQEPEPVGEVAWKADRPNTMLEARVKDLWKLPVGTKLYAAPPRQEPMRPLTDEQIDAIVLPLPHHPEHSMVWLGTETACIAQYGAKIARAIERAHGIGEQP